MLSEDSTNNKSIKGTDSNISQQANTDDFTYVIQDDDTIKLTKYRKNEKIVSVPESINGYMVSSIGDNAFENITINKWGEILTNSQIVKVILPEGIKSIGENAFNYCTELEQINLPEGHRRRGRILFTHTHCNAFLKRRLRLSAWPPSSQIMGMSS